MEKKGLFSKIKQIDSINDKLDNMLETQYVEESGQYINAQDTLDGYSKGVLIEGNTHQNIYDGGEIKVQPNVEATDTAHYLGRSLEGELDQFSIAGKSMKNLATCERNMVVQQGEEVEGRSVTLNTVAGGRVDDITIKGVSMQNFTTEDMWVGVSQPSVVEIGDKISIPDSYKGNLNFSQIKINGKTYNNLLKPEFLRTSNVSYDAASNQYTLTCVNGTYDTVVWNNVFLKNDTVYTIAFTVVSTENLNGDYAPSIGSKETGATLRFSAGLRYIKGTFRTNKDLAEFWNFKRFTIWYTDAAEGSVVFTNPILLEGDFSDVELPTKITGLDSVNTDGNGIHIDTFSQNLVDISTISPNQFYNREDYTVTVYQNTETSYRYGECDISHLKPNTSYTMSANMIGPGAAVRIYDWNRKVPVAELLPSQESKTFTTPENVSKLAFLLYCSYGAVFPAGTSATFSNIQLVEGDAKKPHERFNKTSVNIPLNLPLRSIGDFKDTIEKINGEWYHVQRIEEYKLRSDESYGYPSASYSNDESVFFIVGYSKLNNRKLNGKSWSNLLPYELNLSNNTKVESAFSMGTNLDMRVRLELLGDTSGLDHAQKIDKAIEYLVERNMTVLYELETPILTKIEMPSISVHNDYTFITSTDNIKPEISLNTTIGVDTVATKLKEYSVVFNAENLAPTNSTVNIVIEVDGVEYTTPHTFTDNDIGRYAVRIISENPNPRINFTTPGFKITDVMVLEGYDDEYYHLDHFSGLTSVDKNLDIRVCGANILDYLNPEYVIKSPELNADSNGYISGTLLQDDSWVTFLSIKNAARNRCVPDSKCTLLFDITESSLVPTEEGYDIIKVGNGNAVRGSRCILKIAERYKEFNIGNIETVMTTCPKERFKSASFASRLEFLPNTVGDVKFRYMMVEGDVRNRGISYQPFNEIRKNIVLNDYLRSLPNGVRDTIEKIGDKWYHVKRVGKRILNNSDDEKWFIQEVSDDRIRIKTGDPILSGLYKFKTDGAFNFMLNGFSQTYNPLEQTNSVLLNHVVEGTVQLIIPRPCGESANTVFERFKQNISENSLSLLYELKDYVLTEIDMPEIETMDIHTHIYSYSNLRPIIKASTVTRAKMPSMKPNTTYTLLCTANIHTSTSNRLNIECDGVPYSVVLDDGDNLIKQTFTTSTNVNNPDVIFKSVGMRISDVIIIEGEYSDPIRPNYFRHVRSSGEDNGIVVKTAGANIFKAMSYPRGNARFTIIDDNNIKIYNQLSQGYFFKYFTIQNAKPNTTYQLDMDIRIVNGSGHIILREAGFTDGEVYERIFNTDVITQSQHKTINFTTSNNIKNSRELTIALYSSNNETETEGEVYYENISLREYENIHYTYDKYRESLTNIPLSEPLRSLPDGTQDTIEQKEDGSWVVKRRIARLKLSDVGIQAECASNDEYYRFVLLKNGSTIDAKIKTNKGIHILADMFEGMKADDSWKVAYKGIALNAHGFIDMVIEKPIIDSIGVDNWLAMNDGYVYYETNTVKEEPLPELNKLPLYNYGTHITTNDVVLPDLYIRNESIVDLPLLEPDKEYTLIMDINSSYSKADETMKIYAGSAFTEINRIFTKETGEYLRYYATLIPSVGNSIKIDNAGSMIRNLQIISGNKMDEFLSSSTQFGLNYVGSDGFIKIKSTGKNLFTTSLFNTKSKAKIEILNDTEFIITNPLTNAWVAAWFSGIEFERGVPYTISYDYEILEGEEQTTVSIRHSQGISNFSVFTKTISGAKGSMVVTFTPTLQKHQLEIFVARTSSNLNGKIKIMNLQIEKGTERTSYQSYKENIISIALENGPLRKLPNGICDTIEIINGVPTIVRRVGETTYDGSPDEAWRINDVNDVRTQFTNGSNDKTLSIAVRQNGNIYCSTMVANASNNIPDVCWIYDSYIFVVQKDKFLFDTKEKLVNWLRENPLTICYELPQYKYEPIPNALLSLKTFEDFTHISGHDSLVYPNLTFKFAANLGAIIQASSDRISTIVGKLQKLEEISFTNLMNIVSLQEQLDNHIKKL